MAKKLKITPVAKNSIPKYPDQYSVELKPLLLQNEPLRWQAAPVAGTVLSAVVMLGLSSCTLKTHTLGIPTPPPLQTPLFEHGEGIGVYGCVAVSAPVFLSEDDAFAIIQDEFSKLNLSVEKGGATLEDVKIPKVNPYQISDDESKIKTQKGTLEFDFKINEKSIMMEYVSSEDLNAWITKNPAYVSSVQRNDYKRAAELLNSTLNDVDNDYIHAVFYDPAEVIKDENFEKSYEEFNEEAYAKSAEALREQIKEFIAWLSAQGVI